MTRCTCRFDLRDGDSDKKHLLLMSSGAEDGERYILERPCGWYCTIPCLSIAVLVLSTAYNTCNAPGFSHLVASLCHVCLWFFPSQAPLRHLTQVVRDDVALLTPSSTPRFHILVAASGSPCTIRGRNARVEHRAPCFPRSAFENCGLHFGAARTLLRIVERAEVVQMRAIRRVD